VKRKQFFEQLKSSESIALLLIYLFTFICWLLLNLAEKLGPPDVYKLYSVAEKLFSGDFKIGIVPPLFPLIQYPLSKLLCLFMEPMDAFVAAGRLISLSAGMGVISFTYLFLKRFTGKVALIGITFLVISPWFLKLLSFPITDMLYLFFVSAAFYCFLPAPKNTWKTAVAFILGGVLTRFEGVLMIISGFLNYFKFKKKYFYYSLAAIPLTGLVMFFFFMFADRFFAHFRDIILAQKSYLYIFQHPMDFLNVIYGNILFFIPFSYPYFIKLALLIVILALFGYGLYRLFKQHRQLAAALLVYELLFFIAKGYVDTTRPDIEFRRIFSGLWIFYVLCFLGGYFLLTTLNQHKKLKPLVCGSALLMITALALSLPLIPINLIPVILPLLAVLVILFVSREAPARQKYPPLLLIILFSAQIFNISYQRSTDYVQSMAPKSAYAAAQWVNYARIKPGAVILSYTDNLMMSYYLNQNDPDIKNIHWETFTVPLVIDEKTRSAYIKEFFKVLRERKVDYIICDNYVVPKKEFRDLNQAKRLLFEEHKNTAYFRVKKYLLYKGKNVGYVLKPVNPQTAPSQMAPPQPVDAETDN